jgi:benzoate 4-monooxygenase
MPFGELVAEAGILLNAGNDTTASGLTNTLWLLARHPPTFQKLRAELDNLLTDHDITAPDFNTLMAAPYLRACIDESLRLRPPVAIGLPRKTPKEGSTICGHLIPGGVTVSVPILELQRHPSLFRNPDTYDPDRWFDPSELPNLREYSQPFSIGARACIGRNLAMIELTKVIATVVIRYDVELIHKDQELPMVERFNMNPGDCHVSLTGRVK